MPICVTCGALCGLSGCEEPAVDEACAIITLPEDAPQAVYKVVLPICQKHKNIINAGESIKVSMSTKKAVE